MVYVKEHILLSFQSELENRFTDFEGEVEGLDDFGGYLEKGAKHLSGDEEPASSPTMVCIVVSTLFGFFGGANTSHDSHGSSFGWSIV